MTERTPGAMLRFGYPGVGHPDTGHAGTDRDTAGLSIDVRGRVATVAGAEAIRQSLLMLLCTRPGERVMRPDYGCPLHRLMFQPVDATAAGLAIHYVERAVRRWEPRVEVLRVDAGPAADQPSELLVSLDYRIRSTRTTDTFDLAIDLAGGRP